ncbi:hypothetical protein niasHT_014481 [Heterodera trifolii]|uniref:Uncharacterized protein n=1 Tax=Heterodera trifolii TaxID=157864 RepID=A0ABD2KZE5_9BILA
MKRKNSGLQDIRKFFNSSATSSAASFPQSNSESGSENNAESNITTDFGIELDGIFLSDCSDEDDGINESEALKRPYRLPKKYCRLPLTQRDIGLFIDKKSLDEAEKEIILNCWTPPKHYKCPMVVQNKQTRNFRLEWLTEFPLMAFSHVELGIFCKVCVAFSAGRLQRGKGAHEKLGRFVVEPFRNFKDTRECWQAHTKTAYHKECVIYAESFKQSTGNGTILENWNMALKKNSEEWRSCIRGIVRVLIFMARYELPFRGHDELPLISGSSENEGVFRGILK